MATGNQTSSLHDKHNFSMTRDLCRSLVKRYPGAEEELADKVCTGIN